MLPWAEVGGEGLLQYIEQGTLPDKTQSDVMPYNPAVLETLQGLR